jgi:hypothetical protein
MIGGDLDLLDACFLVAVYSNEAEEKPLWSWQTPDEIIRRAQAKIGINGVRRDCQLPRLSVIANRAFGSSGFVFNRDCAKSCACLSAPKNAARRSVSDLRGILPRKRLSSRKNSEVKTPCL